MHYTFIPTKEKKELRREYRIRLIIVTMYFLSIAVVVGITSLFPTYIGASIDLGIHLHDAETLKTKPDAAILSATKKDLASSNTLIAALKDYIKTNSYSEHINDIVALKGNVKLNAFSFDISDKTLTINIQGSALARDDLTDFKKRIIAAIPGTTIDIPANLLAKATNVVFSLKVVEPLK